MDLPGQKEYSGFIKRSGNFIKEKFQKAITFTILTRTLLTTLLKIMNVYPSISIYQIMQKRKVLQSRIYSTLKEYGLLLKNGMVQRLVRNGIQSKLNALLTISRRLVYFVSTAKKNSRPLSSAPAFAQMPVNPLTEGKKAQTMLYSPVKNAALNSNRINTQIVDSVQKDAVRLIGEKVKGKQEVYNISVADRHEYYAEGVLVSNCDELRYALMAFPYPFSGASQKYLPEKKGDYPSKKKIAQSKTTFMSK